MSTHVKLIDLTGGMEPCLLGRSAAELLKGLPELPEAPRAHAPSPLVGEPMTSEELEDIASYLDPDCPRGEWRDYIAAIRAAPVGDDPDDHVRREIAQRYSRGELDRLRRYDAAPPERYTGPDAVDQVFDTMPPKEGGIGVGTIIRAARKAGFNGSIGGKSGERIFAPFCSKLPDDPSPRTLPKRRNKFELILPRQMRLLPEPRYVVGQIIPAHAVSLMYGQPGSYKSFVVMDLLASTAAGCAAFGKVPVKQGAAILCAGEAPYGIARNRWPAWAQARGIADPDSVLFAIVPAVPLVSDPREIEGLIASIKSTGLNPAIVALDTVALAIGGQDENDARAAYLVIQAAHRICDEFGCSVILVHHAGKDESRGARGSSALAAGVDAVYRVTRDAEAMAVTLRCEKMKDADQPEDIYLMGRRVLGSLTFDWIAKDEHASLTRKNGGPTRSDVGAALRKLGKAVTTHTLAFELAGPEPTEADINAMVRRLQRGAKDQFRAYIVHHGAGGRDATMWGITEPDKT